MSEQLIDIDALAQEIRRVDGNHTLGAGALAEALMPFLSTHHAAPGVPQPVADENERLSDEELPGMWSNSDLSGGATDCVPASQQEASVETVTAFLDLARLYCAVTETPSGDINWTFATRDIEGFAVEVINQHRSRAAATAPAGGVTALRIAVDALEILNRRPRPMCRDCADENGTCPSSGLPCDIGAVIRDARAALTTAARAAEPVAYMVRHKSLVCPASIAFDGKNHYREWSEWKPESVSYAKAVTDPARNAEGCDCIYEARPLYLAASPTPPTGTSKEGGE